MNINLTTKYDLGQKVYMCKTALDFSRGYFIDVMVPDSTPYTITSIRTHNYPGYASIYYRLDGKQESYREDKLFRTMEEVQAYCDANTK